MFGYASAFNQDLGWCWSTASTCLDDGVSLAECLSTTPFANTPCDIGVVRRCNRRHSGVRCPEMFMINASAVDHGSRRHAARGTRPSGVGDDGGD